MNCVLDIVVENINLKIQNYEFNDDLTIHYYFHLYHNYLFLSHIDNRFFNNFDNLYVQVLKNYYNLSNSLFNLRFDDQDQIRLINRENLYLVYFLLLLDIVIYFLNNLLHFIYFYYAFTFYFLKIFVLALCINKSVGKWLIY